MWHGRRKEGDGIRAQRGVRARGSPARGGDLPPRPTLSQQPVRRHRAPRHERGCALRPVHPELALLRAPAGHHRLRAVRVLAGR